MKESYKKRIITKEKLKTYQSLLEDKTLNRMMSDCRKAGLNDATIVIMANYAYQYGYEAGFEAGTAQGIEYAYQHINDLIDKYVPPKGAKNEDR